MGIWDKLKETGAKLWENWIGGSSRDLQPRALPTIFPRDRNFIPRVPSSKLSTKSWTEEITDAIARYAELQKQEYEKYTQGENASYGQLRSIFDAEEKKLGRTGEHGLSVIALTSAINDVSQIIIDKIEKLYDEDPKIIEPEKREALVATIKSTIAIPPNTINELEKYYKVSPETLDSLIDHVLTVIELTRNAATEEISERLGIHYALVNALSSNCELPEDLKDDFKNRDDYIIQTKKQIIQLFREAIVKFSKTPIEAEALNALLEKAVLEKVALSNGNMPAMIQAIQEAIYREEQNGQSNPNTSKYMYDSLKKMLMNLEKGVNSVSPENNTNTMYISEGKLYPGTNLVIEPR